MFMAMKLISNFYIQRFRFVKISVREDTNRGLEYQQNIAKYSIGFLILDITDNNYETIFPLVEKIKKVLQSKEKPKLVIIQ